MAAAAAAAAVSSSAASSMVAFLTRSPSPFHATRSVAERLSGAGFVRLSEKDVWRIEAGKKYFVTRNQSAVVAFAVGGAYKPGNGFSMVASHTDSPCLRIKPVSAVGPSAGGMLQVGVECYGGGLWHTWFDRDLALAGRVIVRGDDGAYQARLVHVNRPIMRIPTLAIHLDREVNSRGFQFNQETHLAPVLATATKEALSTAATAALAAPAAPPAAAAAAAAAGAAAAAAAASSAEVPAAPVDASSSSSSPASWPMGAHHHPLLLRVVGAELGVPPAAIHDFDLYLCDAAPPAIGGALNEFVFAPRLDNLMCSFLAVESLVKSCEDAASLEADTNVRVAALFDNEEVGSDSIMGASSTMLEHVIRRICGVDTFETTLRNSFLVSADMAHAVHPNYAEKHEPRMRPSMHKGVVIKHNCNQRYATNAASAFIMRELSRRASVPVQDFAVRQDSLCGSTIGPIIATRLGIRTVDVGFPQLSMHSIREMCGVDDVDHGIRLFTAFYQTLPALEALVRADDIEL